MSEFVQCVEAITQMMSKSVEAQLDPRGFREQIRSRLTRLFEEGLDMTTVIGLLIARQHEKAEEKILDQCSHDHLDLSDFNVVEKQLGLNDLTPANRERWTAKFKEGRAKYWCPSCGYSGNDEFRDVGKAIGTRDYLMCPQCHVLEYVRFFTRDWTPEEQATYVTERKAKQDALASARIAKADLEQRQKAKLAEFRAEAIKAVKAIDELRWSLLGEDSEDWLWDEESKNYEIRSVMRLMLRPTLLGGLAVPQDDVVAFFKANLKPADDLEMSRAEFDRCAKEFNMQMLRAMEGEEL
jgi:hypothetical protein